MPSFLTDVGPASVIVGNLVQGNRLASAQGRDMGYTDDSDAARKVTSSREVANMHEFFYFKQFEKI